MASEKEKQICKSKRRFANEASAKDALNKINPSRKSSRPYRTYRCPVCSGYHLSSSSKL